MSECAQLVEMSNRYGMDEQYVLAGGGNTSCKTGGTLHVKASGTQLATITQSGFVQMEMEKLLEMLEKSYPDNDEEREAAALRDMMGSLLPGQQDKRPSVECLLHALFPYTFVLHLHPALVNGLTCGKNGKAECGRLFLDAAVWVPLTKPGYVLAKTCHSAFAAYKLAQGQAPKILLMQNHGLIVAADSMQEIDALMEKVMSTLHAEVTRQPDFADVEISPDAQEIAPVLRMLYASGSGQGVAVHCANVDVMRYAASKAAAAPLMLPFTPDQIVYCKGSPLYLSKGEDPALAFASFIKENGYAPKVVLAQGIGFFALGTTKKEADIARILFLDSIKVAVYAESFGGALPLDSAFTRFILGWEAENYRQKIALDGAGSRRMQGKICLVTGGAQGFGAGIARDIAAQGGIVVIADMNLAGAQDLARALCAEQQPGIAMGVGVNVANEESVRSMVEQTVLHYGGLDLLVSCAGILVAGSLVDMTKENFEKVTAVNYTGYFLCAKYGTVPMKLQRKTAPAHTMDIIEINSKSGLEGSKSNFAYAGSKFGGIGLTQSFAMELAEYGIKVNAVCPGNLLDGPLWSDPERGLFRQYLDAGKVPGAKTVQDVRHFYESRVLMNRGCTTDDVGKAIFYLVEQQYETGQALPVTGGQVMLS